jgi:predicted transcriptional regulator
MARPKSEEQKTLTDTEIQIMNILWDIGDGTVHNVLEGLISAQGKDYAYTTVSTLLRVLEKKGVVSSQKEGRGHRYSPAIPKEKYQKKATDHLVENVFSGERTALIRNLLGSAKLSKEELAEVKALLEEEAQK